MNPPRELPADVRVAAAAIRNFYDALTAEGFTEQQTLELLARMHAAGVGKDGTA